VATDWRTLIGAKSVTELVEQAFERLRDAGSAITNLNVGGVARTLIELAAQAVADLYDLLAAVVAQGYVQSATGAWLDAKAEDLGLARLKARQTIGWVRFYRTIAEENVPIPVGVVVSTRVSSLGEVLRFTVSAPAILQAGQTSVSVEVTAERPGSRYNVAPGMITELVTHVEGVEGVVNDVPEGASTWIIQEGTDDETDTALRERCILRWYELTRGATRDAYVAWAMSVPGVADVAVDDRFPRGDGTVDVIITGPSGMPSEALIASVQSYVDARRPICADVLVRGPDAVYRDVAIKAYIPLDVGDQERTRTYILDVLNSLFATGHRSDAPRLRIGQWPYRARLAALAMTAPDVFNVLIEAPQQDEDLEVDQWFVADSILVSVERAEP
jgi:uncharacterized phage protein gp47/JayE